MLDAPERHIFKLKKEKRPFTLAEKRWRLPTKAGCSHRQHGTTAYTETCRWCVSQPAGRSRLPCANKSGETNPYAV